MIARAFAAAHIAVDARLQEARRRRRAEQEMIDTQAGIAAPGVPEIIPKGVDGPVGMEMAKGVGPSQADEATIGFAALRLEKGVVQPGAGIVDVEVCRNDIIIARKDDR